METLVTLNVDAILTNDPPLCKEVIEDHESNVMNMIQRIRSAFSL